MEMQARLVDSLRNAYDILKRIGKTQVLGVDSNIEKAIVSIELALFNLGEEEAIHLS
jgi:hypothetical protein